MGRMRGEVWLTVKSAGAPAWEKRYAPAPCLWPMRFAFAPGATLAAVAANRIGQKHCSSCAPSTGTMSVTPGGERLVVLCGRPRPDSASRSSFRQVLQFLGLDCKGSPLGRKPHIPCPGRHRVTLHPVPWEPAAASRQPSARGACLSGPLSATGDGRVSLPRSQSRDIAC